MLDANFIKYGINIEGVVGTQIGTPLAIGRILSAHSGESSRIISNENYITYENKVNVDNNLYVKITPKFTAGNITLNFRKWGIVNDDLNVIFQYSDHSVPIPVKNSLTGMPTNVHPGFSILIPYSFNNRSEITDYTETGGIFFYLFSSNIVMQEE